MTQITDRTPTQTTAPASSNLKMLDRSLARGVAWTAGAKWSSQLLSWASLIIVARLLSPADFGLVGMATLYLGLVTLLSEFGVGTAVLVLRDLKEEQIGQLNCVSLLIGFGCFLASCGLSRPLGVFFHAPKLPAVVVAMSTMFIILGLRSVPYSLLQRDMRFKLLSVLETGQSICQALSTLVLAFLGLGYWSLVVGNIAGSALLTITTAFYCRHGFAVPRPASIWHALRFSSHILVSRLCWYAYSNADFLVAGRVLGPAPLGEYTFGWNLATAPIEKVSGVVVRVTPAFFAAVQDEHAALRRYLRVLTEVLGIVTFPATFGLALVAHEFVPLALGRKWSGAIVPLELLAFYASFRVIVTLLPQVLNVVGETRFGMRNAIATAIIMPTAFYIGSRWGTTGIAAAWIITYPVVVIPLYWRTLSKIGLGVREYMQGVVPPLNGSIAMAVAVEAVKWSMHRGWPLMPRLMLEIVAGGLAYVAVMLGVYRSRMLALWQLTNSLLRRKS
jgi:O-antigen/teichoic acid export membrane protein